MRKALRAAAQFKSHCVTLVNLLDETQNNYGSIGLVRASTIIVLAPDIKSDVLNIYLRVHQAKLPNLLCADTIMYGFCRDDSRVALIGVLNCASI